jgi:hypothetical protein
MACLAGCGSQGESLDIRDVRCLPQDPLAYIRPDDLDRPLISREYQEELHQRFRRQWLAPWDAEAVRPGDDDVRKPFLAFVANLGYGQNLLPHSQEFADALLENATGQAIDARAITVANTNIRQLPTDRPRFEAIAQAGEGFPFDTFQESALWAGSPVRLWRVTRDGQWGMVDSACGRGWIPMRDLAEVDEKLVDLYRRQMWVALTRDHVTVGGAAGPCVVTHIGAVFPLINEGDDGLEVLLPVRDADGRCLPRRAKISKNNASVMPIPANPRAVAELAREMIGQPYGWGGMFQGRDCSSTVRDLLIPLGIPMPRNSAAQAAAWVSIPLKSLPPQQREDAILKDGMPFLSLVRIPGHIALYLGRYDDRAVILHNTWGIRTRRDGVEGRKIIGRCVITTLQPGVELTNIDLPRGDLRNGIESLVQIGQPKRQGP